MVSVVAVATHAGVSPATVSRVLSGRIVVAPETRARVLEAVKELGYRPNEMARSLRAGRGRGVALVTGDVEQGIYAALAKHVQAELEALGLDLLLFNLGHREDRLRHFLERAPSLGLRGVLLSSPHIMDMAELMPLILTATASGIDVISVSQDLSAYGIASIIHDDVGGARAAAEHLIAQGRTPIAFLGRIATSAIGRARFEGYRDALLAHEQAIDPDLVWDISEGYRADAGYQATSNALAKGLHFRAVLTASDELALGSMAAATDRGHSVPGSVAFVGFGGLGWGVFSRPSITTVSLDVGAVARAVRDRFKGEDEVPSTPERIVVPARLVLRQSA
ncbi:LacI family DNA-binding transcriptional regulator [Bosea lathyri]|uniref:Transcriptional regulator, LacI family n=1 Tax=Bosea lathyri TaxID=1036778 RepID=A0A1H6CSD5_9HYPH|nr:LacI family DNA-binding transcriptional regulator [Bosea lathyri]SEG75687.1 transcriptional regulator, LacI family [Bosea lathyri]